MAETVINVGAGDNSFTLDPKYTSAKFLVGVPSVKSLTIISNGSAGHDVFVQRHNIGATPTIQKLTLSGNRIRFHRDGGACSIGSLVVDCIAEIM